ncbi:hypothetical protein ZIOFF_007300 [Zingiber officinale]|uniref:Cytochrome b5 heme-binding domain-containing protein n=1 Tax=Zingiber officinale TaxID=94328 RepID=A0A8J5HWY8_ZINOF|nr:hypothetical protein ZIOFF_007300 [Zingiber officinale]
MADSKVYHFEEVVKHNVAKDCWLFIHGKMGKWNGILISWDNDSMSLKKRKDATNDFDDIGHSNSARDMMAKYYIGQIDSSTVPAKRVYVPLQQAPNIPDKSSEFLIKILQFLVPILILGLALAVRKFTKVD